MGISSNSGPFRGAQLGTCRWTDVSGELMDVTFQGPWLGDVQFGQCVPRSSCIAGATVSTVRLFVCRGCLLPFFFQGVDWGFLGSA